MYHLHVPIKINIIIFLIVSLIIPTLTIQALLRFSTASNFKLNGVNEGTVILTWVFIKVKGVFWCDQNILAATSLLLPYLTEVEKFISGPVVSNDIIALKSKLLDFLLTVATVENIFGLS